MEIIFEAKARNIDVADYSSSKICMLSGRARKATMCAYKGWRDWFIEEHRHMVKLPKATLGKVKVGCPPWYVTCLSLW